MGAGASDRGSGDRLSTRRTPVDAVEPGSVVGESDLSTPERTKTAEPRVVPMSRRLIGMLTERRTDSEGERFPEHAYVFGNEVGERTRSIKTAWENCRRRAGITGLDFHDLRREFGSRLRESGASDHDVRDWLGHSNITTTSRYLATTQSRLQQLLKALEARESAS